MAIIQFDGLGEELVSGLVEARDAVVKLRDETTKENEALKKMGADGGNASKTLATNINSTADALAKMGKQAASGTLSKSLKDADVSANQIDGSIEDIEDHLIKATFAADSYAKQQRQIRADALKVVEAIAQKTITEEEGEAVVKRLTAEYRANAAEMKKIEQAARQVEAGLEGTEAPSKSLRTQLKEAKEELDRLVEASDGKITPELIEAAQKAGNLADRMGDLTATVDAFNPDTKFKSFLGVLGNIAGAAQAVQAGVGLIGEESEDVNRALLKVQQTTALFQGLQSFIGGLADNWKNLRTVILASQAATQADTAARTANAAASGAVAAGSTAAAGATGVLAGAFNALKAAIVSNPIGAIAVALVALGAAFAAAASDTRDYAQEVRDLNDELDRITNRRIEEIDQKKRLADIGAEREALEAGETEAAKRRRDEVKFQNERAALVAKQLEYEANMLKLINELESLRGKDSEKANTAREEAIKKLEQETAAFQRTTNEIKVLEGEQANAALSARLKETADRRAAAREKLKIEQQLAADILSAQQAIAAKAKQLEQEGADPRRRVELEREAQLEEIRLQEQTLLRKLALAEIEKREGVAKFKELSEAQKTALADALITEGAVEVGANQQQEITDAQLAVWQKYWKDLLALDKENRATLLDLQDEGFEKDRAAFDASLEERIEKLRAAGATEIAIAQFVANQKETFLADQIEKAIADEEKLALAKVEAQERGAETEEEFRRRIEGEKLDVLEKYALQRLSFIKDDGSAESALAIAQLKKIINDIKAAREQLGDAPKDKDIFDLLGIKLDDKEKQQVLSSLQQFKAAVIDIAEQINAAQQEQVQAQIDATDALIEDGQRRRDELNAQLEAALKDQEDGYANNADAIRAQIAAIDQAETQAQAKKAALIEEQKRLAKQQIAIDSALQISSLATANANLFASGSKLGLPGIIQAAAAAASMIALVLSIKAKIRAINAGDGPTFRRGGVLDGPAHEGGGIALFDRRNGHYYGEAEGGEYVVNTRSTRKHRGLLDAINEDSIPHSHAQAIHDLLSGADISVSEQVVREVVVAKERIIERSTKDNSEVLRKLSRQVQALTEELQGFREQEKSRPRSEGGTTFTPNRKSTKK